MNDPETLYFNTLKIDNISPTDRVQKPEPVEAIVPITVESKHCRKHLTFKIDTDAGGDVMPL